MGPRTSSPNQIRPLNREAPRKKSKRSRGVVKKTVGTRKVVTKKNPLQSKAQRQGSSLSNARGAGLGEEKGTSGKKKRGKPEGSGGRFALG